MSIESAVIDVLKADPALVALVSEYLSAPAIFTDVAPEGAETPFIVCRFTRFSESPEIGAFNLFVDYFDFDKSRADARDAILRIEVLLDQKILEDSENEYNAIRAFAEGGGSIPRDDPRDIQYNLQFTIRAGRRAWSGTT